MTRLYRARRITQPLRVLPRRRDPSIDSRSFTCFRLVPDEGNVVPIELVNSNSRMFVFTKA